MVEHAHILASEGFLTNTSISYTVPGGLTGFGVRIQNGVEFRPSLVNGERFYCGDGFFDTTITHQGGWIGSRRCLAKRGDGIYDASGLGIQKVSVDFSNFKPKTFVDLQPDNIRKELIYTGKSGNQIFITYREFKSDLARPAFSQNLSFDMKDGNVFGFQGSRFEVIDASNTNIVYKLLSPLR